MGSSTYVGGSHLSFRMLPLKKGAKLPEYGVYNIHFSERIGLIHWRGGWMQYVFRSEPDVDMSRSCYNEITNFIDNLMSKWNASKKQRMKVSR